MYLLLLFAAFANDVDETVVVQGDREQDRVAATVTVVAVDDDLTAGADVAEAVDSVAGAVVHRLGGLGDWSAVSLRGASPRSTVVAIDGIPLNPDGARVVDLSELPLRGFERVEVYRGGAPPEFGTAAMGGVVNLVTAARGAPPSAAVTLGTLQTGRLHIDAHPAGAVAGVPASALLSVDGLSTSGAFAYFDDRNTPHNPGDDVFGTRSNNDTRSLSGLARVRAGGPGLEVSFADVLTVRDEGVPGPISLPTRQVRYQVVQDLAAVQAERSHGATTARLRGYGQLRQERFDDRAGEIGLGTQWTRDTTTSVGAAAHAGWAPEGWASVALDLDARHERYLSRDRLAGVAIGPHRRWMVTGAASARLFALDGRVLVQPVAQAVWLRSASAGSSTPAVTARVTPRLAAVVDPARGWTVKAGAGRYLRPPDFLELYGDRGAFRGQSDLRPERGWQADLGVRHTFGAGSAELVGFWSRATDLIAYVQNGQRVVVPMNLGAARVRGLEAAVVLDGGAWLDTHTTGAWTVSENLSDDPAYAGNRLPRIPALEVWHRTLVQPHARMRLGHTLSYTAGDYGDATNRYRSAPRMLHGVFAQADLGGGWSAEIDVRNLTDRIVQIGLRDPLVASDETTVPRPITDFSGFPLPGRTALATLRWEAP